ncbi:MAG TPA: ubiquinone/menaquinone biosynthesis methyltransferase [Candidatus Binataceae bacterium]|nr:ubiquinone/menaquinone biosynthesis methyltransferase [Candidatus Binataceae bacterium]
MLPPESGKAAFVQAMFDRISPRYDLMNRLMTFGMDRGWRRRAIEALGLKPGGVLLDLACGTGDLADEAAQRGALVVGLDFSDGMLREARRRNTGCVLVRADALALPLAPASCDAIVTGFALRNFTDLARVFVECARVLRPGGRIALLEVDSPRNAMVRVGYRVYFHNLMPLIGRLIADRCAYSYLSSSVAYLPSERGLFEILQTAGFENLLKQRLLGGGVQLISGRRAADGG